MLTILDLRDTDDPQDYLHRTVQTLVEGEVVAVPTEAGYGLIAHALNGEAVEKLIRLNHQLNDRGKDDASSSGASSRDPANSSGTENPSGTASFSDQCSLLLPSVQAAGDYLVDWSPLVRRLAQRCWPGPLQIEANSSDSKSLTACLCGGALSLAASSSGQVAFRVVSHRVIEGIHRYLRGPLLFAGLNDDHGKAITTAAHAAESLIDSVPLLLDDGPTRYGGRPTSVSVENQFFTVRHQGVIEEAAMNQIIKPVVVLVCTGNTCRSPMAETLLRERFRVKFGREDLVRVLSAGVAAGSGYGASSQAVEVMGQRGLDLTGHSSQPLDDELINVADVILTMTRGHRSAILAAWPELSDRVQTLRRDGGDVSDPVGMPVEVYEACAKQIDSELEAWIEGLDDDFFPSKLAGV